MFEVSRRVAIGGLLAATGCATAKHNAVRAGPPMWVAGKGAGRVYLFGQFPLPKGINWLTPEIEQAFAESKEVWFENPDFDPRTAGQAMQKRAALGGPKLNEVISVGEKQRLADVLAKAGRPADALDAMLVWQAYLPLSDIGDAIAGMDPASIPERVLKPRAKVEGKMIKSEWTSMEEIMEFSAGQAPQQQLQLISKTLDEIESAEVRRAKAEAWALGDISSSEEKDAHFRRAYPDLSARLIGFRNRRWAQRIEEMLARGGPVFVCVGLGHLVGQESIQAYVDKAGTRVLRI